MRFFEKLVVAYFFWATLYSLQPAAVMLQNVKSAAYKHRPTCSGAVINLKVQVAHVWRKALGNFFVVPFHFLALKVQLVVLVSAFVMVSTVWSVSCLLFFYSRCSPVPSHL